jgi:hypothetical protein
MSEITIKFADYKIPDSIYKISNEQWKLIFDKLDKEYSNFDSIELLDNKITSLDDKNASFDDKTASLVSKITENIKSQITDNSDILIQNINKIHSIYNTNSSDKIIESITSTIQQTLEPINKLMFGIAEQKGTLGEALVENMIREDSRFDDAIIKDTSGISESCDRFLTWKSLKCLIEVKNKKIITTQDINKFERDIRSSIDSTMNINSAIFISLLTSKFPNKSHEPFQIEIINNIPVIYIHIINKKDISYALLCLEKIISHLNPVNSINETLMEYLKDYYNTLQIITGDISKDIKAREKEIKLMSQRYNVYLDKFEKISFIFNKYANTKVTNAINTETDVINIVTDVKKDLPATLDVKTTTSTASSASSILKIKIQSWIESSKNHIINTTDINKTFDSFKESLMYKELPYKDKKSLSKKKFSEIIKNINIKSIEHI